VKARVGAILSVAGVLAAGGAAAIVNAQVLGGSSSGDSHALAAPETVAVTAAPGDSVNITDGVTTTAPASTPSSSDATTTTAVPSTLETAPSSLPSTSHTTATTPTVGSTSTPSASVAPSSSPATTQPSAPATTPPTTVAPTAVAQTTPATQPSSSTATYQLAGSGTVTLRASGDTLAVVGVSPAPGWSVHDSGNQTPNSVRVRVRADDGGEVRFEASVVLGVISTHTEQNPDSGGGGDGDD
jgi:hypothetical protein